MSQVEEGRLRCDFCKLNEVKRNIIIIKFLTPTHTSSGSLSSTDVLRAGRSSTRENNTSMQVNWRLERHEETVV